MIVRLGYTFLPYRAEIVCGILRDHDIWCTVWHEHAASIYAPGWATCQVMIDDEDLSLVEEILRATVEEPQPDITSEPELLGPAESGFEAYPSFATLYVAGLFLFIVGCVISLAVAAITTLLSGHYKNENADEFVAMAEIIQYVLLSPLLALPWACLTYLYLLPLRVMQGSDMAGFATYVWVRFAFPMFIVVIVALWSR